MDLRPQYTYSCLYSRVQLTGLLTKNKRDDIEGGERYNTGTEYKRAESAVQPVLYLLQYWEQDIYSLFSLSGFRSVGGSKPPPDGTKATAGVEELLHAPVYLQNGASPTASADVVDRATSARAR